MIDTTLFPNSFPTSPEGYPLTTAELYRRITEGETRFTDANTSSINFEELHYSLRVECADDDYEDFGPSFKDIDPIDWKRLYFGQTPEQRTAAIALRLKIADLITSTPKMHNQYDWGLWINDNFASETRDVSCDTACCIAGWAGRFVAPHIEMSGDDLINMAFRALWVDDAEMPSFDGESHRHDLIRALRSVTL